jgi:hypothetical protein
LHSQLSHFPILGKREVLQSFQDHLKRLCDSIDKIIETEIKRVKAEHFSIKSEWCVSLYQLKGMALGLLSIVGSFDVQSESTMNDTLRIIRGAAETSFHQIRQSRNGVMWVLQHGG